MDSYYDAANKTIEKWTNRIFKAELQLVMPVYFFPLMVASYYRYYVLGMAEKSFYMIYPTSYVETAISYHTIFYY